MTSAYDQGGAAPDPGSESIAFGWSAHLVRSMYAEGVRHVVVSPGSRSTPLTLACAAHAGLEITVALDERSAGFIALGIGKASAFPAALICTSGTAAANYAPAVWEARNSGTPIVILTADRPPSLRGTGSSQTMDQIKMFGDAPVFFHECGEPRMDAAALGRLAFAAKQAVEDAMMMGGAAHLNLPFDKPFEPGEAQFLKEKELNERQVEQAALATGSGETGLRRRSPVRASSTEAPTHLLEGARRPIVVAGPMNHSDPLQGALREMFDATSDPTSDATSDGFDGQLPSESSSGSLPPVLADPGALTPSAPSLDAASLIAAEACGTDSGWLKPDLVIRIGDTPFSGHLTDALTRWSDVPTLLITSRPAWQHPFNGPGLVERWITRSAPDLRRFLGGARGMDPAWSDAWRSMDREAGEKLLSAVRQTFTHRAGAAPLAGDPAKRILTDLEAIHRLWERIPEDAFVMLSNSLIPRDVALLRRLLPRRHVFVNRGVAGIDGITSTAVGIALAGSRPVWLLTGDLAFLHDSNALLQHVGLKVPVTIGLIDNGGGSIFRSLPIRASRPDLFRRFFETPQAVDAGLLCRAHGIPYHRIQHPRDLDAIPEHRQPGFLVFDVKTDPDRSHQQRISIRRHLRGET